MPRRADILQHRADREPKPPLLTPALFDIRVGALNRRLTRRSTSDGFLSRSLRCGQSSCRSNVTWARPIAWRRKPPTPSRNVRVVFDIRSIRSVGQILSGDRPGYRTIRYRPDPDAAGVKDTYTLITFNAFGNAAARSLGNLLVRPPCGTATAIRTPARRHRTRSRRSRATRSAPPRQSSVQPAA